MFLLRAADEVRAGEYELTDGKLDPKMVEMAGMIMQKSAGKFDPTGFRDRYQDALRELIEAKLKGQPRQKRRVEEPSNVVDLMAALRRSLSTGGTAKKAPAAARKRGGKLDKSQGSLLLPIKGGAPAPMWRSCSRRGAREVQVDSTRSGSCSSRLLKTLDRQGSA